MNRRYAFITSFVAASLAACGLPAEQSDTRAAVAVDCPVADESGSIAIVPGLSAKIINTGYGRAAVTGDYADTNVFQFQLGNGQVIKGWDLGVPCMLVGETRELVVASDLAYGAAGRGDAIPPNTPLIFSIELVKLTAPE